MRRPAFIERLRTNKQPPQNADADKPVLDEGSAPRSPESQWFWDHYNMAAGEVIEAFQHAGVSVEGKRIADVGCGDGFIDLGVLHKGLPQQLVGFDLNLTDVGHLRRRASEEGVDASNDAGLSFERSEATRLPATDAVFDLAFSWSAFEHILEPAAVLSEIRRILRPEGIFFLQLWPFYLSAKGSHLWDWFPEDFHHLQHPEPTIVRELESSQLKPRDWTEMMSREFQHLNRLTVEELQRCMLDAGFVTRRLELLTSPTLLTPELARYSWLDLGISGIKLIATPG
jgi:ubiquinone/menaquinone biosynthesis C-methylase UbiE